MSSRFPSSTKSGFSWFCIYSLATSLAIASSADAASPKAILKMFGNSSDEALQGTNLILKRAIGDSGEGLENVIKKMPTGTASTDDVISSLKKLGSLDDLPLLTKELDSLTPAMRSALMQLVSDSRRIVSNGVASGMTVDHVVRALEKAGPESVFVARSMRSPESLQACLKGFDEYGEKFSDFARRADDAGVSTFEELKPKLVQLPKDKLDDILKNPTKYFDSNGRPIRALEDLLSKRPTTSMLGRVGKATQIFKDGVIVATVGFATYVGYSTYSKIVALRDLVRRYLEPWVGPTLASYAGQGVMWVSFLGMIWFILALLFPWGRRLGIRLLGFLLKLAIRGTRRIVGRAAQPVIGRLEQWSTGVVHSQAEEALTPGWKEWFLDRRPKALPALRLGLLGFKRAGKTTFTVMLRKKLEHLVPGSDLSDLTEHPDGDTMRIMAQEVAECRPTKEDKHVRLKLDWPFGGDGQAGGKMHMQLVLADFPGEWASPEAKKEERSRLAEHLRRVDGLLIVIDPTDLEEGTNLKGRFAGQREAIESMFKEDGLDLGRSFRRAIVVVVTKRDAITPGLLQTLAERSTEESRKRLDAMQSLASQQRLTEAESSELGLWILGCLCPTLNDKIITKLGGIAIESPLPSTSERNWRQILQSCYAWFKYPTRPQLKVFCISQMGFQLGRQVVEHRREVQDWERSGGEGDRPTVTLDLDGAATGGMDLHFPFKWLFDHIPAGWLHECAGISFGSREIGRWLGPYQRFSEGPAIKESKSKSWRRLVASSVVCVALYFLASPLRLWTEKYSDRHFVEHLVVVEAAGSASTEQLRHGLDEARGKNTGPYPILLNTFEELLKQHDELDDLLRKTTPEQILRSRIEAARDWVVLQSQLTGSGEALLANYQKRLREPTAALIRQLWKGCEELVRKEPSDDDWRLIHNLRSLLERDQLCNSGDAEVVRKDVFDGLTSLLVDHDSQRLRKELEDHKAKTLYSDALRLLKGHKLGEMGTEGRIALASLREDTVLSFWLHTGKDVKQAAENADLNQVEELYGQFLRVDDPNPFRSEAVQKQSQALDLVVVARLKKAADERDSKDQWELLKVLELHLSRMTPSRKDEWLVAAAQAKQGLNEWPRAFHLLGELGDGPLKKSKQQELWQHWIAHLETEVPRLLANQKVDDARTLVFEFRQSRPAPEFLARCRKLEEPIPGIELQEVLNRVAEIEKQDPQKALELLRNVAVNVDKIKDADRLKEWRRKTVDLYEHLDKHPDAAEFIDGLREAKLDLLPHDPKIVDEIWQHYHVRVEATFTELVRDNPNAADAWRQLRDRARDERAPEDTRNSLQKFAFEQILKRMPPIGEPPKDLAEARKRFELLKKVIDPWRQDKTVADALQGVDQKLTAAEFRTQLAQLKKQAATEDRKVHEDVNGKYQMLISKPGMTGDQKKAAENDSEEHLRNWELDEFTKLFNAYSSKEFSKLADTCNKYLDGPPPFHKHRPDVAVVEAGAIRKWLQQFNKSATYSINGIKLSGLPNYTFPFDPAVEVRIGTGNTQTAINAQADSQTGTVVLKTLSTTTLNWRKGEPIAIEVWDDKIRNPGYCFGLVNFDGEYGLLDAVSAMRRVPCESYDYKSYTDLRNLEVGLSIPSPSPLDLPRITSRK